MGCVHSKNIDPASHVVSRRLNNNNSEKTCRNSSSSSSSSFNSPPAYDQDMKIDLHPSDPSPILTEPQGINNPKAALRQERVNQLR
jgi:hypothetical protein